MVSRTRFFQLVRAINPGLILASIILLTATVSCSHKSGGGPTQPDFANVYQSSEGLAGKTGGIGHSILGAYTLHIDSLSGIVEIMDDRTVEAHSDIYATVLKNNPKCPGNTCVAGKYLGNDASTRIMRVDFTIYNPLQQYGYDVRLIFPDLPGDPALGTEWQVSNADSYTHFYDTDPEWSTTKTWLNPFIAFMKQDFNRKFQPAPSAGTSSDTEQVDFFLPQNAPPIADQKFFVDVNYPLHCYEPYQIMKMSQLTSIPEGSTTSSVYFEAVVADWQISTGFNESDLTNVSLYCPDIIAGDYLPMTKVSPAEWPPVVDPTDGMTADEIKFLTDWSAFSQFTTDMKFHFPTIRKFYCNITNDNHALKGEHDAMVIAKSPDLDGTNFDTQYNKFQLKVAGTGSTPPNPDPYIVFVSDRKGSMELYTYMLLTGNLYQVTEGFKAPDGTPSTQLEPSVSTDGSRVAFVSDYDKSQNKIADFEIYWMFMTIVNHRPIKKTITDWNQLTFDANDERTPDYSPDGTKIAYAVFKSGQYDINTLTVASPAIPHPVTISFADDEAPEYDRSVAGGTKLYFMSDRYGGQYEISWIDPTTTESNFNKVLRLTYSSTFEGYPATDPLTGDVVFVTNKYGGALDLVHWVKANNQYNRITENEGIDDTFPCFSEDGERIAFCSTRVNAQMDIFEMPSDGGSANRLTNHNASDIDPFYGH